MKRPDLGELLGDVPGDERERLQRVHELLLAAGPPPDVPAALAAPPVVAVRRRRVLTLALAAALAVAAFAGGYAFAERGGETGFEARRVIALHPTAQGRGVDATIHIGRRDDAGNWPMRVTVTGLQPLPQGDYYEMSWLTEDGRKISCGTFKVATRDRTSVTFSVAYALASVKGWELSLYRARGHRDIPLARA